MKRPKLLSQKPMMSSNSLKAWPLCQIHDLTDTIENPMHTAQDVKRHNRRKRKLSMRTSGFCFIFLDYNLAEKHIIYSRHVE